MKLLIVLNVLCFVLFTTTAALNAFQDKWVLTTIWSLGALCWVVCGILNYRILKIQGN